MPRETYILFHKPYGVLSQFTAEVAGQRTLAEFGLPKNIYAAGRLDQDSEGLLLLTDDAALIHDLLEPVHGHPRTYHVQVEGVPDAVALANLRKGVSIGNYVTRPAKARMMEQPRGLVERDPPIRVRKSIPTSWIELELVEGKNRQVRRMTAAVGYPTLRLIRSRIGPLSLEGLAPGAWRPLSPEEIQKLRERKR